MQKKSLVAENMRETILQYHIQKRIEKEKEFISKYDKLTGLLNRDSFVHELVLRGKCAKKNHSSVGVLVVDLDRFSEINNQLGQMIGNQILISVAERLLQWRQSGCIVARIGNDEFGILLSDNALHANIKRIIADVENVLTNPFHVGEDNFYITFSFGVSLFPQDCMHPDRLIEKANIAVNLCKEIGGGVHLFYQPSMEKNSELNVGLEREIRLALEHGQFVNLYQPIVSLNTHELKGVETLLRWQHPIRGLLSPSEFLSICEKSGLIIPIDNNTFKKAVRDFPVLSQGRLKNFDLSINFSARHFMQGDLPKVLAGALEFSNVPSECIVVEVTESLLLQGSDRILHSLQALHDMGVQLAIDDFGTGYASLSYLKKYPFDVLKIDASFVREIGHNKNDEILIMAMVNMSKSLGYKVVAEGISNELQRDFLKSIDCDFGQGYLFGKPQPLNELAKRIDHNDHGINSSAKK